MKTNKINIASVLLFLVLFVVSCEDNDSVDNTYDQLFRPVGFSTEVNGTEVTFSWTPFENASYSLEVSRDSFLFEKDLQVFSIDEVSQYTIGDLWSNSRYSARIKAISKDSRVKDSEFQEITFVTGTENIFYAIEDENIGMDQVLLKWDSSKDVTEIVVSAKGMDDIAVPLSESDVNAGEKLIEGLSGTTDYTFKIYYGEMLRGTITATTL